MINTKNSVNKVGVLGIKRARMASDDSHGESLMDRGQAKSQEETKDFLKF